MRYLKDKQYVDAKDFAGECESVVMIAKGQSTTKLVFVFLTIHSYFVVHFTKRCTQIGVQGTCKYGTRLDYILGSPWLNYKFVPGSYAVLSSKGTSDHHIVKVDLLKTENTSSVQEIDARKKHQPKKRVVRITNSSSKGIWSTDMR